MGERIGPAFRGVMTGVALLGVLTIAAALVLVVRGAIFDGLVIGGGVLLLLSWYWRATARKRALSRRGFHTGRRVGIHWLYEELHAGEVESLELPLDYAGRGEYVIHIPGERDWQTTMPKWARERRTEIVERLQTVFTRSQIFFQADSRQRRLRMTDKVVVLSGSGLSAESGLPTFRDANGLWRQHSWMELASPDGWRKHPELVLAFYDERRARAWAAQPNAAHLAIASLEQKFDVAVITQNVDGLHERAGSTRVLHLHGELAFARGSGPARRRRRIDAAPIEIGQKCEEGTQLRPDIVWFGEQTQHMEEARELVAAADRVLVVGTSLSVYPAASLADHAAPRARKVLNSLEMDSVPRGFEFRAGPATAVIPALVDEWIGG